jgi:hypothetical protein
MTERTFDRESAQEMVKTLNQSSDWLQNSNDPEMNDTISRISSSCTTPERIRYEGDGTEGYLSVSIPAMTGDVAEILLINSFDPELAENTGRFVTALGDTRSTRSEQFCSKYFEPLSSPTLLAKGRVPADFDQNALCAELAALYKASEEVDALHDQLWAPLAS